MYLRKGKIFSRYTYQNCDEPEGTRYTWNKKPLQLDRSELKSSRLTGIGCIVNKGLVNNVLRCRKVVRLKRTRLIYKWDQCYIPLNPFGRIKKSVFDRRIFIRGFVTIFKVTVSYDDTGILTPGDILRHDEITFQVLHSTLLGDTPDFG